MEAQEVLQVSTHFPLEDETKEGLKGLFPGQLKTIKIDDQVYVFKPLTKLEWDTHIINWLKEKTRTSKTTVTSEERTQRLIDVAVVFPAMPTAFQNNPAIKILFWNQVAAGTPDRLVQLISHHSGFFVPGMIKEKDIFAQDLFEAPEMDPKPSQEDLNLIKDSTDMPCRLIRIDAKWWVIRGMKYFEAKNLRKNLMEDPEGDAELDTLKNCILFGEKNFNKQLAGVVNYLIMMMNEISGLSADGESEPLLDIEAEDL
jgi:hypothetical protein